MAFTRHIDRNQAAANPFDRTSLLQYECTSTKICRYYNIVFGIILPLHTSRSLGTPSGTHRPFAVTREIQPYTNSSIISSSTTPIKRDDELLWINARGKRPSLPANPLTSWLSRTVKNHAQVLQNNMDPHDARLFNGP